MRRDTCERECSVGDRGLVGLAFSRWLFGNAKSFHGGGTTPQPQPSAGTSQLSVTLSDAPPAGVSVLSFEVNITGALLQPVVGTDVSVLPGGDPVEIEVKKARDRSRDVEHHERARGNLFKGLQLTLAHPTLTVFNGSTSDIGACKVNTTCQFKPSARRPDYLHGCAVSLDAGRRDARGPQDRHSSG